MNEGGWFNDDDMRPSANHSQIKEDGIYFRPEENAGVVYQLRTTDILFFPFRKCLILYIMSNSCLTCIQKDPEKKVLIYSVANFKFYQNWQVLVILTFTKALLQKLQMSRLLFGHQIYNWVGNTYYDNWPHKTHPSNLFFVHSAENCHTHNFLNTNCPWIISVVIMLTFPELLKKVKSRQKCSHALLHQFLCSK